MSESALQADDDIESISAFGDRIGRAHSTVIEAIQAGRIPPECVIVNPSNGRRTGIHWRGALAAFVANTDTDQAERAGSQPIAVDGGLGLFDRPVEVPAAPAEPRAGDQDREDYLQHRARTEKFRSQQAELDYLAALGKLVPVDEFRESGFKRYRALRDKLLNIPDRIATVIAAERDPAVVHQKLTVELKRVLSELSDDASAEVARGAAERMDS
jgi:hypothetical protein